MGFGTCFMHLSRSNLSVRLHLHQAFLCSRLCGNNLFERFHLHPCSSHTFSREAPIYLHFLVICFLDNYRVGRKILNRLWFANSGWIFHKNFSTKHDWYLGAFSIWETIHCKFIWNLLPSAFAYGSTTLPLPIYIAAEDTDTYHWHICWRQYPTISGMINIYLL